MTNPVPPDGPFPAGAIAGVDETVIYHGGGVTYALAGVVFLDAQRARRAFQQLTANRKRAFHWRTEGSTLREEAVTLLENHIAATYVLARTAGRRQQVNARRELLAYLVAELTNDGIDHLIIESQGTTPDGRDRNTILDSFQANRSGPAFTYEWRTKTEPLLWYPDALAGVAHESLAYGQTQHFERLQKARVATEVHYVADQPPENA
ncbi:MAG: hypothetical protein OXF41_09240 [bacterium]|nr:hypothetical protein [Acidimicrobiia bacterium]MCY4369582.1 hypothetical protein [bacterium]